MSGLPARASPDRVRALSGVSGVVSAEAEAPLAPLTSLGVGGPAELLVEARSSQAVGGVVALARDWGLPLTLLGGGSNLLVSDAGVRGVVLRLRGGSIGRLAADRVRAEAGVALNGLVRWAVLQGAAGLAEWAGTPGSMGGALYGNAHFQGRLIGERIAGAELLDPASGESRRLPVAELELGYDRSRLQRTGELALAVEFAVESGEPSRLRQTARASLLYRKRTQPLALRSAGCVFQNPDPERVRLPPGVPCSAGALIDRAGLKGHRLGGARVSEVHANFIVNEGGASAADVAALALLCRERVAERFGVELREEIVRLGDWL